MIAVYLLLMFLVSIAVPVVIILLIVRAVTRHGQKGAAGGTGLNASVHELTPRQVTLGIVLSASAFAGIAALYVLPTWLLDMTSDASIFAVRIVGGFVVLVAGLLLLKSRLVSILLMTVGIISILLATPYIFSNFGSAGALLVIFVVLVALIGLAIFFSTREHKK